MRKYSLIFKDNGYELVLDSSMQEVLKELHKQITEYSREGTEFSIMKEEIDATDAMMKVLAGYGEEILDNISYEEFEDGTDRLVFVYGNEELAFCFNDEDYEIFYKVLDEETWDAKLRLHLV